MPTDQSTEKVEQSTASLDDVWDPRLRPGDYEFSQPIPEQDPRCPNCGYPFDSDEWDERHTHGGPSLGEDWHYTCPKCNNETLECGI